MARKASGSFNRPDALGTAPGEKRLCVDSILGLLPQPRLRVSRAVLLFGG